MHGRGHYQCLRTSYNQVGEAEQCLIIYVPQGGGAKQGGILSGSAAAPLTEIFRN